VQIFLIVVSLMVYGMSRCVMIDAFVSTVDYKLVVAVLDTLSSKTVKIVAGPYSALGSFPSQF